MPITGIHPRTSTARHPGGQAAGLAGIVTGFDVSLRRTAGPGEPLSDQDRVWPGLLRRAGRIQLRLWKLDVPLEKVELLLSELVTNGYAHGHGGSVRVRLWRTETHIGIEVSGERGPTTPRIGSPGPDDESGRGLLLVSVIADEWGVTDDGSGTWCLIGTAAGRP